MLRSSWATGPGSGMPDGMPSALASLARSAPHRAGDTSSPPSDDRPTRAPRRTGGLTRRSFVRYGAGSLAGAGLVGGTLLPHARPAAGAVVVSDRLDLFVNEGHVAMVDGSLVYMRGFGEEAADDPSPSLTIGPSIFLAGGGGPVASRFYPLLGDDHLPEEGTPAAAGIDTSGPGLHFIRRQHWASFFPRRTLIAEEGSTVRLRLTNRLAGSHTFTIDGVVDVELGPAASATAVQEVDFEAPPPGTYIYHDTTDQPVNRVLGLFGVLVVIPTRNRWTFDGTEGEFERQFLWIMHDIDPAWARQARLGRTVDPKATPCQPRYFTLNDRSGVFSLAVSPDEEENRRTLEDTKPSGHGRKVDVRRFSDPAVGTGQLLRLVNTGVAVHQPHFHGNHVWTIAVNNATLPRGEATVTEAGHLVVQLWEDVVEMDPMTTKAVILPLKPPPDALDVVVRNQDCEWVYPMHCHAEMSQTAGGGLYPGGIVSDWVLKP